MRGWTVRSLLAALAAVPMIAAGCGMRTCVEDEKAVISKIVKDSICWALTKDRRTADATMAHDPDLFYFWVDWNDTVSGWEQHSKLMDLFMDPKFKATRTEVRDLRVTLSRSGDVAWYSALLDDVAEWDGRQVGATDIRWTGVLEKRGGTWVIVQMHASLAADKVREKAAAKSAAGI